MEHITIKLPERVLDCVKEHYSGHSLICSKEDKDSEGHVFYIVDLLHKGKYCHLKVSDLGKLIHEEVEPQFANGYHEQYY
jgi:hypothetical protein